MLEEHGDHPQRERKAVKRAQGQREAVWGRKDSGWRVNRSKLLPVTVLGSPKHRTRLEGIQGGGGQGTLS